MRRHGRGLLMIIVLLVLAAVMPVPVFASTHTASSCKTTETLPNKGVQDVMDEATEDGAIVEIPVCSGMDGHWTVQVTWSAPPNAILRCAGNTGVLGGGDATIIIDDYDANAPFLVLNTNKGANGNGTFRMYGCTFNGGIGWTAGAPGPKDCCMVFVGGNSKNVRIDHNTFNAQVYQQGFNDHIFRTYGYINGVMDHNILKLTGTGNGIMVYWDGYDGTDSWSDAVWATDTGLGTSDAWFVEDNLIESDGFFAAANDCQFGGKWVFRHNTLNAASIQTHPTQNRDRGCRSWEFYKNIFDAIYWDGTNTQHYNIMFASSGTGIAWGNDVIASNAPSANGFYHFITLHSMRRDNSTYGTNNGPGGWGFCGHDFLAGTVTVAANGLDVTKTSGNPWIGGGGQQHYTTNPGAFINIDGVQYVVDTVTDGTHLTLTSTASAGIGLASFIHSNYNENADPDSGKKCMDQPGNGRGDRLINDFPNVTNQATGFNYTDARVWPRQALEPMYEFRNNWTSGGAATTFSHISTGVFQDNQTYYRYVGTEQINSTTPFDGTVGVGSGPITFRPLSCTPGVYYWATNEGEWDSTNGATPDGKGYVCDSPNHWKTQYGGDPSNNSGLPYCYPHPLVSGVACGAGIVPPSASRGRVNVRIR